MADKSYNIFERLNEGINVSYDHLNEGQSTALVLIEIEVINVLQFKLL